MAVFNREELKYVFWAGIVSFLWFTIALPRLYNYTDSPINQFLLFYVGLYVVFFIFLKALTSNVMIDLKSSVGLLCLFISYDILIPEYHVNTLGQLNSGALFGSGASDYVIGFIASNYLHLQGYLVYLFTYFLAPMFFFFLAASLLPNFVRRI